MQKNPDIKIIQLNDIKPYWRNPRKISEAAVNAVAVSIQQYGFNQPLVIDSENVIIVGHTRYKALKQLGIEEAACVVSDMSKKKAREYRIADNKTNEMTGWDLDNLGLELREIDLENIEPFFSEEDLKSLCAEKVSFDDMDLGNFESPSQEKIDKKQGEMSTSFVEKNEKDMNKYINVICPECGEEFSLDKTDILKEG